VTALLFGEVSHGRLVLRDVDGKSVDGDRWPAALPLFFHHRGPSILVSRLDYDVQVINIPRVPVRRVPGLIESKLPLVYPGSPDQTILDYRVLGTRSDNLRIAVYLMRQDVFGHYRDFALAGNLTTLDALAECPSGTSEGSILIVTSTYAERLVYHDGLLCESHLLPATAQRGELPAGSISPWDIDKRRRCRSTFALFHGYGRHARGGVPIFTSLLAASALVLLSTYAVRSIRMLESGLERAALRYQTIVRDLSHAESQNELSRAAMTTLENLDLARPVDLYGFFAGIAAAAANDRSSKIHVDRLSYSAGLFSLAASGSSPFRFAEALSARDGFRAIRVTEIFPAHGRASGSEPGSVQFALSGNYDGR